MEIKLPSHYNEGCVIVVDLRYGYSAKVTVDSDDDLGEPWEVHDGHGPVSEWTWREKKPSEVVIAQDRNYRRFYDFAAAIELAKKDGWDAPPYKTGTKSERAHRAVMADYKHLKRWCDDEWHWIGVVTKVFYRGEGIGEDSLWGFESEGDHWQEVAREHIENVIDDFREKRREQARRTRNEMRRAR